jgi:hypothetical protein
MDKWRYMIRVGTLSWHPRDATLPPTAYLGMYETGRRSGFTVRLHAFAVQDGTDWQPIVPVTASTGWL